MNEKLSQAIKEIAVQNGVALSKDDPVMILYTINEVIAKDNQAAQQELLNRFQEEMEASAHRWSENTKSTSEKIINASLKATTEAMEDRIELAVLAASEKFNNEIDKKTSNTFKPLLKQTKLIVTANILAACITLIGSIFVFLSS